MEPRTETVNAKDWIEANEGIKITAYIENRVSTLSVWQRPLPSENLFESLRKISVIVTKQQPTVAERELDMELQAWDALSDEALVSFEQELS